MTNISFPVYVFEPISLLERFSRSLGYAPFLLEKAGMMKESLEQFKYVKFYFYLFKHFN